jgi:hypothetical protein
VNDGGTLGGTGSLGRVNVNSGGHLSPGSNGCGTLTIANSLILYPGSILDYDLNTPAASDLIFMSNARLTLNSQQFSDFHFNLLPNFGIGTYTLVDAASIGGSLGDVRSGWLNDKYYATLSVSSSNGNLMLTVVPEPAAIVSLLIGVAGLFAFTRRRK